MNGKVIFRAQIRRWAEIEPIHMEMFVQLRFYFCRYLCAFHIQTLLCTLLTLSLLIHTHFSFNHSRNRLHVSVQNFDLLTKISNMYQKGQFLLFFNLTQKNQPMIETFQLFFFGHFCIRQMLNSVVLFFIVYLYCFHS